MNDRPPSETPTNVRAQAGWTDVIEDMESTAATYRERGWRTLELHPGDSVFVDSERRTGIDVLLPGPEFSELESIVADHTFGDVEVFRAERGGVVYLLAAERDTDAEAVAFVPAYYHRASSTDAIEAVREAEELRLFCRRLNDDTVELVHDDPEPFLPEAP
ncbi:DUF7529 family protein [Halobellus ruber]|uniref:Uncharacterized protein n=1 Tax=Halobellus ruber TaxID=2761102 RepID=A0A7J9SE62_9EURY|nr:hypothetical protein [Halobellus ruber]MBB6645234.1 hypothetical protein [Halobellus ruber]